MALTTRLPPELVVRVFDFVDPPTLVDLACTCKFLERCSRGILRKHRTSHVRYRVVTDVAPQSLVDVLRKALSDQDVAWHVRELEFTRIRTEWSHWKESDDTKEVESTETSDLSPSPDYAFTQDERVDLLSHLREVFQFTEEHIDMAYEDLQQGNDAPLKLLLVGVCPKIRSVKFSRNFRLTGTGTIGRASPDDLDNSRSSLEYFHQAIVNQLQSRSAAWPVGLDSLQDLAIGVETGEETGEEAFAPSPTLFANCMQLPNLTSLYCFGLITYGVHGVQDYTGGVPGVQDYTGVNYQIEERSSSVQGIFLDWPHAHHEALRGIIAGCKQLKSLTIAGGGLSGVDDVIETAGRCYQQSLETLMLYDPSGLHGRNALHFLPESMKDLTGLRTFYIAAKDVLHGAYEHFIQSGVQPSKCKCDEEHFWMCEQEFFVNFCLNSAFPESTEVLVLGTKELRIVRRRSELLPGDADLLDQAITTMIECSVRPTTGFKRSFPNLKAIYLSDLEGKVFAPKRRKRRFSKAIAAGRKFGVDVHTRTTRGRPFHQVDFPKPPTITTTKFAEDVVFDIYTGKWAPSKCGNCGTCEKCLKQYDASVWKEVEEFERERS
jgi:hypothetical protein